MYNIILVCTKHKECGKCNSDELYKIIESISPEIIFEELPPSNFHRFYQENIPTSSLETNAIRKYLQNHTIEHIPVDTYEISDIHYIEKELDILNVFDNYSEYSFLKEKQSLMTNLYGFIYLNSKQSDELFDKIRIVEEKIIKYINDEKLFRAYQLFNEINNKREDVIINNIYNYSKEHKYYQAILFCGAAHRKSIIKKIHEYKRNEKIALNWLFYK